MRLQKDSSDLFTFAGMKTLLSMHTGMTDYFVGTILTPQLFVTHLSCFSAPLFRAAVNSMRVCLF